MKLYTTTIVSKKITGFFYLLSLCTGLYAQKDANFINDTFKRYHIVNPTTPNDSLLEYSYKDLYKQYTIHKKDSTNPQLYIIAYLRKAKNEKNEKQLLHGYLLNLMFAENDKDLLYGDSLIKASKDLKNKPYEARGYYYKGIYYYNKRKFKSSLDQQLIADSIIAPLQNNVLTPMVSYNIGLLKDIFEQHEEALEVFKKNFNTLTSNKYEINNRYFRHLFALSNAFRRNKVLDSAMYYCKLGLIKSENYKKNTKYYYDFLLTKGILDFELGHTIIAEKNITNAKEYYETTKIEHPNLSFCYYYQSLIDKTNNKSLQSIYGMKKVDSTYLKTGFLHPELKNAYKLLISYYKSKKDVTNQLVYVERLLKINNLLHSDYRYVSKNITDNYETPKLLKDKEQLINSLSNKK